MIKRSDIPQAGLVTTRNWIVTPNGDQHHSFWCDNWLLETDKELELVGLKTSDRWAMVALNGDKILAIIPGCEVLGYIPCAKPPSINVFMFK